MTSSRDELSSWVGGALLVGGLVSIGLVAVGVVFDAVAITRAGLLVVVLTPIARLAAAGSAFLRHGELRYAAASAVVLALLLGGLAVAVLTAGSGS